MKEHFDDFGLNSYLSTPGGKVLLMQHGSRRAAAAALAEAERADRAWRREQAVARFERHPDRYPSVDDALARIPDPVGGGVWMGSAGTSTDEIVALGRAVDPRDGWQNLGLAPESGEMEGYVELPGRGVAPADTRAPWEREREG